jgi:hypothetical protein
LRGFLKHYLLLLLLLLLLMDDERPMLGVGQQQPQGPPRRLATVASWSCPRSHQQRPSTIATRWICQTHFWILRAKNWKR